MNLTITAQLIRDLLEHHGRADNTGIILTSDGWEIATWADRQPAQLIGITQEDACAFTGADDPEEADPADIAALAESEDFRIRDEDGDDITVPGEQADPQVVTAALTGGIYDDDGRPLHAEAVDWQTCWWFDQARAVCLIEEDPADRDTGTATSLWRTGGGRFVMHTRPRRSVHYARTWTEIDETGAAQWAYYADPDLITDAEQPPVIAAARHARALVDAMTPPKVPWIEGDSGQTFHRADRVLPQATSVALGCAAITELLRFTVAPRLRRHRITAARTVELAHDGNQAEAARTLGMGRSTFAKLVNP